MPYNKNSKIVKERSQQPPKLSLKKLRTLLAKTKKKKKNSPLIIPRLVRKIHNQIQKSKTLKRVTEISTFTAKIAKNKLILPFKIKNPTHSKKTHKKYLTEPKKKFKTLNPQIPKKLSTDFNNHT